MSYSDELKATLDGIIEEMAAFPSLFAKNPRVDFIRNRKIPFDKLIHLILGMKGNSLNKEMYEYYKNDELVTTSAFVQQRNKLLPEALEFLFHEFNDRCNDSKTYEGYHLYAVDGSSINILRNSDTDSFIARGTHGYNQLHINAMYDLLNKTYVDAIIQPKPKSNEVQACIDMIRRSKFPYKTILMADRYYGSINLFETINRTPNLEYLIRIKDGLFKELRHLPMSDFDKTITLTVDTSAKGTRKKNIMWPFKWDFESPYTFSFRVVRFKITEDTYETIITSLNRFAFPASKIKELYHLRWGIETSFRELKYAIGLVNFHTKNEDYIKQEIFAKLIMYNFCERITLHVVVEQDQNRKWTYQVNFTMGIHICSDFFRYRGNDPPDVEKLISFYILPVREGRSDARKKTTKSAVHFLYRVA